MSNQDKELRYFKQLTSWGKINPENVTRHGINEARSFSRSSRGYDSWGNPRSYGENLLKKSMAVYSALCVGGTKEPDRTGPIRKRKPQK